MRRLINWFIDNPVASNLLMALIFVGGMLTVLNIKQEVFPDAAPDVITVTVVHAGATPEEIEEGICVKIEEEIEGLEGVKEIHSTASEGAGMVSIELNDGADKAAVLDDVKTRVDGISTFPDDAEKPVIVEVEMPNMALELNVSGPLEPLALKRYATKVREDLIAIKGISRVEITNASDYEISIEVSEDSLRRFGLTFDDLVRAVRQSSLNLSGGTIKAEGGEIQLRSDTQAYVREDFEKILLIRSPDGTRVTIGDVGRVVDGFEDEDLRSTLDGVPALNLAVFRVGEQSAPEVAAAVFAYLERTKEARPEGIEVAVGQNWAQLLEERRALLLENGKWGLVLIFGILAFFLRLRLAFWVALGIPTALLGAVWLLPSTGASINMMSLFGFIVVLGILVDDAIVVGENIVYHSRKGADGRKAARLGTHEVMVPVVLAVLTTIAAFVPMLNLPGWMGKFAKVIPIVVICALSFSLIESLLILPHHLSHMKPKSQWRRGIFAVTEGFSRGVSFLVDGFTGRVYRPALRVSLRWRYVVLSLGAAMLVLTAALFGGKIVKFTFMPPIEGDQIIVSLTMPEGTPIEETEANLEKIRAVIEEVRAEVDPDLPGTVFRNALVSVGVQPQFASQPDNFGAGAPTGTNLGEIFVQLHSPEKRGDVRAEDLRREIRDRVGDIPGARRLGYEVAINAAEAPISIELTSKDLDRLRAAADYVKSHLRTVQGTFDIQDDMVTGKREILLFVTPEGEALGLTQAELARQVRQGFYGDEAQRIQRGPDDVKVMVRYPEADRRSLGTLEDMRIRLPGDAEVPFRAVARAEEGRGPASIHRSDGRRAVSVTSDVDLAVANANEIVGTLEESFFPALEREFPDVAWALTGEQQDQGEALAGLFKGVALAVFLIYALLALVFGSFAQPFIVLLAVPFGVVGAVLGHWYMGLDFTMLSAIGILAMAGVVVNDSMILVDFINRARKTGMALPEAVLEAGPRRFRAIMLTSLTTFAGLTPLLLEKSMQAQFLIPMAVSLSFGVIFSTLVILIFVPASVLALEDLRRIGRGLTKPLRPNALPEFLDGPGYERRRVEY